MHRSPFRASVAAATLLAVAAVLSPTAEPVRAQEGRFGEEISITEVEIPVQVLRRGEPVRGLRAEDFEVFDQGERREIVGFRVIDLARTADAPSPSRSEGAFPEAVAAKAEPEGRRILLLFDFLFSRRHHLERSLLGTQEMVARQLHPSDRVAVAYLTGGGANLLLGFTRNRAEIAIALDTVHALLEMRQEDARAGMEQIARGRMPPDGADGSGPRRTAVGHLNERFGAAAAVALMGGVDPESDAVFSTTFGSGEWPLAGGFGDGEIQNDAVARHAAPVDPFAIGASLAAAGEASAVRTLTLEMSRLATLLRDVPGQKHMLYLSEGFSSAILNDFGSGHRALVLRYVENLFESLRRGGWTLHAMDVGGIPGPFSGRGFDADALHYLAAETGGQLYENYNRIHQATERLVERTSVTYVLTIRPGDLPADGRLHRLDVRLVDRPPRTRVLHRTGYYAPKPAAQRSPLERQLDSVEMVLGDREVDGLETRVLAGGLPAADGLVPVPVVVEIPGSELGRTRSEPLDLQIQVYAMDVHGGVQDLWLRRLRLDPAEVRGPLSRGGLRVLGGLAVPPGEYRLRVLVQDPSTGRLSLSTRPLSVGAPGGDLLPLDPVIVDRSGDWLELVSLPRGPGGLAGEALALGAAPVVPPVWPTVRTWEDVEVLVVVGGGEPVDLAARVLDAGGREVVASLRSLERLPDGDGSLSRYLGRVATANLAPGRYRLEVRATGAGEGPSATRTVGFQVRD